MSMLFQAKLESNRLCCITKAKQRYGKDSLGWTVYPLCRKRSGLLGHSVLLTPPFERVLRSKKSVISVLIFILVAVINVAPG